MTKGYFYKFVLETNPFADSDILLDIYNTDLAISVLDLNFSYRS